MTSQPAPSLTLLNLDILEEVLSYYAPHPRDPEYAQNAARRRLLNFSLLSRQLVEPALRVLWRSMDDLLPLLQLLPQLKLRNGQYVLCNDFFQISWARFDFYARKIQVFRYHPPYSTPPVNPLTYGAISRARKTTNMLPNLRSLLIDLERMTSSFYLESLLNFILPVEPDSTLRQIVVWSSERECLDLFPLFTTLGSLCTNIQAVRVRGIVSANSLITIPTLHNLRRLHFSPYFVNKHQPETYPVFLQALSRAVQLQEITMDLGGGNYAQLDVPGFYFLKRASLSGDVASLARIVDEVAGTALIELDLAMKCGLCHLPGASPFGPEHHANMPHEHHESLNSLTSKISVQWRNSMTSLSIHVECRRLASATLGALEDLLVSTGELTNLRSLNINLPLQEAPSQTRLDTPKLIQHLTKLVRLECLHIPHISAATLKDIQYLVFHLPSLRTLRVSISLDHIPPSSGHLLDHRLETLDLSWSATFPFNELLHAHLICWNLHQMFPYLANIICDNSPTWSQVSKTLKFLGDVEGSILNGRVRESSRLLLLPPIWRESAPSQVIDSSPPAQKLKVTSLSISRPRASVKRIKRSAV